MTTGLGFDRARPLPPAGVLALLGALLVSSSSAGAWCDPNELPPAALRPPVALVQRTPEALLDLRPGACRDGVSEVEGAFCRFEEALAGLEPSLETSAGDRALLIGVLGDGATPARQAWTITNPSERELIVAGCGAVLSAREPQHPVVRIDGGPGAVTLSALDVVEAGVGIALLDASSPVRLEGVRVAASGVGLHASQVDHDGVLEVASSTFVALEGGHARAVDYSSSAPHSVLAIRASRFVGAAGAAGVVVATHEESELDLELDRLELAGFAEDAVRVAAGSGGGTGELRAVVTGCHFGVAAREGLARSGGLRFGAHGEAALRLAATGNELDGVLGGAGNVAALALATFDHASLIAELSGNRIRTIADARGISVVAEARSGHFDVALSRNTLDGIGREAIFVSGRNGATGSVEIVGNRVGQGEPVAFTGRQAIELTAEDDAHVRVELRENRVAARAARQVVLGSSDGRAELVVLARGNELDGDGGGVELAVASDEAHACLAAAENRLGGTAGFALESERDGALLVEELATLGSRNGGAAVAADAAGGAPRGACDRGRR